MKKQKNRRSEADQPTRLNRRSFLHGSLAAFAGLLVFNNPAMGSLLDIQWRTGEGETPSPDREDASGLSIRTFPVAEIAKPFLNEKYEFDITFFGAKTASGFLKFTRENNWVYKAQVKGVVAGAVSPLVKYRQQEMISTLLPKKINGKERFITTKYYRKTIKTDGMTERHHAFNYRRRRWEYTKTKNGVTNKKKTRRIKKGQYYDDFLCILYNLRGEAYGPIEEGRTYLVNTIPWTRTVEENGKKKKYKSNNIGVHIAKKSSLSEQDRKWMEKEKAKVMIIAKVDKNVFGIKSGEAKFIGDKQLKPIAARVVDAIAFGDVVVKRK